MKKINDDILRQMILTEMHHTLGTDESYSVHEGDMCEGGCGHDHSEDMEVEDELDAEMMSDQEADPELDYEGEMSKSNLYHLAKNATMLHNMLKDDTNLEPWVQEKIAVANSMIKSVTDYLEYQSLKKR